MQNALPVWHTHSTVTGSATTLGISNEARVRAAQALARKPVGANDDDEDDMFEAHFANMGDEVEGVSHEGSLPEEEPDDLLPLPSPGQSAGGTAVTDVVMVMGKPFCATRRGLF